jgi:hypothetical protein
MSTRRALLVLCCLLIASPRIAVAQDVPLSRVMVNFFTEGVRMTSGSGAPGNPHEVHFLPGLSQQVAPFEMQKSILTQLSTFPLGTSSGGFTYTLDSATGAITPSSPSFGPSFAERPFTIGERKFNAGFNYQHVNYTAFEGLDLDDGEIAFVLPHNDCCPAGVGIPTRPGNATPPFEGDLVESRLSMSVKTDTTVLFANYGFTNKLEVGVAVPFVRTDVRIGGRFDILRLATAAAQTVHSWDGAGATVKEVAETGASASGIGDVLIRGKYAFLPGILAGEIDIRLPSGDSLDLLGTGGTQTGLMLIVGASRGNFSPHFNFGYVFASGSLDPTVFDVRPPTDAPGSAAIAGITGPTLNLDLPDQITYSGGFDWAAAPRVTIAADIVGRTIRDVTRFSNSTSSFQYRTVADGPLLTETREQLNINRTGNLNLVLGTVGTKLNIATNLLLTANVLFPLSDAGLRPGVTPVFGLDYAF